MLDQLLCNVVDLWFTNQDRAVFKTLGVTNGFPVLVVETNTWTLSSESID
jgi:hypothetical protein